MFVAEKVRDLRTVVNKIPPGASVYCPFGASRELFYFQGDEFVLDGPAGTGKTRSVLEKVHIVLRKYPGARGLIVRRTRASLSQTALVTYENHVLGPELGRGVKFNTLRQEYRYKNGSICAIGGLDKDIKIMSAEYDIIAVIEATEVLEETWEAMTTRLRNGRVPYQQIIADCNPVEPTHWLRKRAARGALTMRASKHQDNPTLFDPITGEMTARGRAYMAKLDALTGVRRLRLREGLWVQAEGAIYTEFERDVHLIDSFEIPKTWPRYLSIDFGFTNPFVCQFWAQTPDGELILYREIYRTKRIVEDHCKQIAEILRADGVRPLDVICDHDAEDRATLERHLGYISTAAYKSVSPGIQAVAARLRKKGNGRRGIYIFRDALADVDEDLDERKKPTCTAEEIEGYVWDTRQGRRKGEDPVKENDHGLDALRYLVAHVDDLKVNAAEAVNSNQSIWN